MNVKRRLHFYSESSHFMTKTALFAILFGKQTTNLLNITTSVVPYAEDKYGLTYK